jgi:hypothetical protein
VTGDVLGNDAERIPDVTAEEAGRDRERDEGERRSARNDDEELGEEHFPRQAPAQRGDHSPSAIL